MQKHAYWESYLFLKYYFSSQQNNMDLVSILEIVDTWITYNRLHIDKIIRKSILIYHYMLLHVLNKKYMDTSITLLLFFI